MAGKGKNIRQLNGQEIKTMLAEGKHMNSLSSIMGQLEGQNKLEIA